MAKRYTPKEQAPDTTLKLQGSIAARSLTRPPGPSRLPGRHEAEPTATLTSTPPPTATTANTASTPILLEPAEQVLKGVLDPGARQQITVRDVSAGRQNRPAP